LPTQNGHKYTGLAIGVAIGASIVFYLLYHFLFSFIVGAYASYDETFASGLGAFVLVVLGSNILAFSSGASVARKAFPKASVVGIFYGLATLLFALAAVAVLRELARSDGSWIVATVNVAIIAVTIFAVRVVLLSGTQKDG
jgi:hypothetical protein